MAERAAILFRETRQCDEKTRQVLRRLAAAEIFLGEVNGRDLCGLYTARVTVAETTIIRSGHLDSYLEFLRALGLQSWADLPAFTHLAVERLRQSLQDRLGAAYKVVPDHLFAATGINAHPEFAVFARDKTWLILVMGSDPHEYLNERALANARAILEANATLNPTLILVTASIISETQLQALQDAGVVSLQCAGPDEAVGAVVYAIKGSK